MTQKEVNDYAKSLEPMTLEQLEKAEQKIIKQIDKVNEETSKKEYELAEENYKVVAGQIRYFLNKQTVQWQLTLALVTMYDFWDPDKFAGKIAHPLLDSTLRTLGSMQFTGYEEWAGVIAINKYFEPLNKAFSEELNKVYDLSAKHNALIDEIQKKTPIGDKSTKEEK